MHFNIEATLKIWFDRVLHRWLYFLRGYQPHQINTLFRYMPCAKRGASGNSCQPQTGTRASKKTDLIVSSSWYFHFHISFENLVTFMIHRQRHIRVRYICAVSDGDHQYSEAFKIFKTTAKRVAISYAFKVALQRRMFFAAYITYAIVITSNNSRMFADISFN